MDNTVQADQVSDLDLEAIFSGGSDQPIEAEEIFECKNPHWSISRDGLRKILQIVLSFPSKMTVYMAVWRDAAEGIHFHANNRDALVDAQLPLLNKDNPYKTDRVYFLDTVKLWAFVNSYNQFALSFDPDGTIFYESPYVRYKLDTIKMSLDDVMIKYGSIGEWYKFPLSKSDIGVFKNLYSFAVKLSDSKILLDPEHAEAFYTLYKYSVQASSEVKEKIILRRLDLSTLKEIVDDKVSFAVTKERLVFSFDIGVVSFLRVPYDENSFMYPDTFLTGKKLGNFDVDVPLIKRALKLSTLFNAEELVFSPEGADLYMIVSERAKFKVGKSHQGMSEPFSVGAELFSNILSTVNGSTLEISVTEHGIMLECDDKRSFYSMSRTSMSQIKQGKLPPVLSTPSSVPQGAGQVDFRDSEVL